MSLHPIAERYIRADNLEDLTLELLDESSAYFAGGTDMIPLQLSGVTSVDTLVDVKATGLDRSIERDGDQWQIGALTTLADLEDHEGLADDISAIRAALRQVATRQIRNRATIGGNLLQRPRCSYFRDAQIDCWMKGGDGCPARDGLTEYLGVVPNDTPCIAVQPSDLASVLVMAGASVEISSPRGTRHVDVADLLAVPTPDRRSLHSLEHGEIIRSVTIPAGNHRRST
ncbi:MAG: FAD binding domain-containing protein, partial [Ilumatobacter sp.]